MSVSSEDSTLYYEEIDVVLDLRNGETIEIKINTLANDALPLEFLMKLESKNEEISGQRLWEGSLLLCQHIIEYYSDAVVGKKILELGAGCGLAGLLCAKLGAAEVWLTDGDEKCLSLISKNIEANNLNAAAKAVRLDWFNVHHTSTLDSDFDYVIAGDVLYKHDLIEPLFSVMNAALGRASRPERGAKGGLFLLCHIPRAGVDHSAVETRMSVEREFSAEPANLYRPVVGVEKCDEDIERAKVYTIRRNGSD